MSDPRFDAPGVSGRAFALAARGVLHFAGAVANPLAWLLDPAQYRAAERASARLAWRAFGAQLSVHGLEHARGGPFVVVPLHEGLVDPLLLSLLPLPLRYVARDELWDWRDVGPLLRAGGHLPLPAEADVAELRGLVRAATGATARGESLVVFPQGSVLGVEVAFQRGAFWLARALGLPVLPVVLVGTHRLWEHPFSPRLRRRQPVSLRVLPPVTATLGGSEYLRGVERQMRLLALADGHARPRRFVPARDGYWDGYPYEVAPEFADLAADVKVHRGRPCAAGEDARHAMMLPSRM